MIDVVVDNEAAASHSSSNISSSGKSGITKSSDNYSKELIKCFQVVVLVVKEARLYFIYLQSKDQQLVTVMTMKEKQEKERIESKDSKREESESKRHQLTVIGDNRAISPRLLIVDDTCNEFCREFLATCIVHLVASRKKIEKNRKK